MAETGTVVLARVALGIDVFEVLAEELVLVQRFEHYEHSLAPFRYQTGYHFLCHILR